MHWCICWTSANICTADWHLQTMCHVLISVADVYHIASYLCFISILSIWCKKVTWLLIQWRVLHHLRGRLARHPPVTFQDKGWLNNFNTLNIKAFLTTRHEECKISRYNNLLNYFISQNRCHTCSLAVINHASCMKCRSEDKINTSGAFSKNTVSVIKVSSHHADLCNFSENLLLTGCLLVIYLVN